MCLCKQQNYESIADRNYKYSRIFENVCSTSVSILLFYNSLEIKFSCTCKTQNLISDLCLITLALAIATV